MKKLSKLLLVIMLLTFISPVTQVYAEPNEEAETEEPEPEEETEPEEEAVKVDEDNENPTLFENEEDPDQSKRDKEEIKKPIETPASVTGEKYRGSGTVVDFSTTGSKAFYTVKAPDNSVFYIVIDLDKTEDNVYFMTEINGEELNLSDVVSKNDTASDDEIPKPIKEEKKEPEKQSNLTFWLIIIVGGIGFFGYHFFFGKLKNLNPILKKNKETKENYPNDEHDIYNENSLPEENEEEFDNENEEEYTVSDEEDDE